MQLIAETKCIKLIKAEIEMYDSKRYN